MLKKHAASCSARGADKEMDIRMQQSHPETEKIQLHPEEKQDLRANTAVDFTGRWSRYMRKQKY
jgi:hypothetical protein